MSDRLLPINEMYACVQGEGKLLGVPHILIRVSGCRLRCQFADSFCDTPYSSWKPEKGNFTYQDVREFYGKNSHIHHTMITGGGPTLHAKMLKELCKIGKEYYQTITIETEGSEYVSTMADLISLSPKLSNSTPRPGTIMPYTGKVVTEGDKKKHEKWRRNYDAMKQLIEHHPDYQLKPVISSEEDLEEVKELQKILDVPNHMVYLMPEGLERHQLNERRKWLTEICVREGYNFTDRLHIITYGDERGV